MDKILLSQQTTIAITILIGLFFIWLGYLNNKKITVFGPDKFASQLEGSKGFMKNLCKKNNIPTANFGIFNNFNDASNFIKKTGVPIVVKADGLAAGKGVSVCTSTEDALKNTKEILEGKFKSSNSVVLEEFLEGEELSYFVIVDENSYYFFGNSSLSLSACLGALNKSSTLILRPVTALCI